MRNVFTNKEIRLKLSQQTETKNHSQKENHVNSISNHRMGIGAFG